MQLLLCTFLAVVYEISDDDNLHCMYNMNTVVAQFSCIIKLYMCIQVHSNNSNSKSEMTTLILPQLQHPAQHG